MAQPTPRERMRAAVAASHLLVAKPISTTKPLKAPVAGPVTRQLMADKIDWAAHTYPPLTRADLKSRKAMLERELEAIENELDQVSAQLAALPT